MKQVLQNMKNGETTLADVPTRPCGANEVLVKTRATLISAGTERMLVDFGRANLINKARQQPDKVRMVLEKVRTDGLLSTIESVQSKLEQPLPLGYCNVGVAIQVGNKLSDVDVGDRVISNGPHADVVCVPQNLVAKIPDNVDDASAVFTVLASIGLQGMRLAEPMLGESVVVSGLGLIGLLTVQLLKAQGCRVLGIDFDQRRLEIAQQFGAETFQLGEGQDPVTAGIAFSRGRGVDAVLITAATKSSDPISQAANMCRKRGRIVLVGVTGLELNRSDFYEKELSFQVSCSYGPGRYDAEYESGQDYPVGFVRWTMQRNFEAILDSMAAGQLDAKPLITHQFDFEKAVEAYEVLANDKSALGIVLEYEPMPLAANGVSGETISLEVSLSPTTPTSSVSPNEERGNRSRTVVFTAQDGVEAESVGQAPISKGRPAEASTSGATPRFPAKPVCGFIGAGNYGSRVLIPAFQKANAQLHTIVSSGGVSAAFHGRKAGFRLASTDVDAVMTNTAINTVVIATRHNTHSKFAIHALNAGKHVFVEKPLALTHEELDEIEKEWGRRRLTSPPRESGAGEDVHGTNEDFPPTSVSPRKERSDRTHSRLGPSAQDAELNIRGATGDKWGTVHLPNCPQGAAHEGTGPRLSPILMVGFNRRFAPMVVKMKELIDRVNEPKSIVMTMNAGAIPANNWIQDPTVGGGRIIGEACHLIDLMRFLVGHEVVSVQARRMGKVPTVQVTEDKAAILLGFADGSFGTIQYLANGGKSFPKERFEVFAGGSVLQLNNFRKLQGFGVPGFKSMGSWRQDKGHAQGVAAFLDAIEMGGPAPIPYDELVEVSRVAIDVAEQLRTQR